MVLIAGHRGARDLWPENSLLGFRNLCGLGVDAVEFDIHQSVDGGLVVIHDPLLDRTTHDSGPVGVRTLRQLTATRLRDAGDDGSGATGHGAGLYLTRASGTGGPLVVMSHRADR